MNVHVYSMLVYNFVFFYSSCYAKLYIYDIMTITNWFGYSLFYVGSYFVL